MDHGCRVHARPCLEKDREVRKVAQELEAAQNAALSRIAKPNRPSTGESLNVGHVPLQSSNRRQVLLKGLRVGTLHQRAPTLSNIPPFLLWSMGGSPPLAILPRRL